VSAADLDSIEVGQIVTVSSGGRAAAREGVITKIGIKLVHIRVFGHVDAFRKDTRRRNDGYSGSFRTLARRDDDERGCVLVDQIRGRGIELSRRYEAAWTTRRLAKLAEALEAILADDEP
jgi:hypothetical protein